MKKFILGLSFGLILTAVASVNSGDIISAELFNKLLDIKVSTGTNVYVASMDNSANIQSENISGWILKNSSSSGLHKMNFSTGLFSTPPICTCSVNNGSTTTSSNDAFCNVGEASTGFILINMENAQSASTSQKANINCVRAGADYKPMKSIREIIQEAGFNF